MTPGGLLPVEECDAQVLLREPQRDRAANEARADYHDVVGAHVFILLPEARWCWANTG